MNKTKKSKVGLLIFFLILLIIIIIIMGLYMYKLYNAKRLETEKTVALQSEINTLNNLQDDNNTINDSSPKISISEGEFKYLLNKYLNFKALNSHGTPLLCSYDSTESYGLQLYTDRDEMYEDITESDESINIDGYVLILSKTSIPFEKYKNALLEYISENQFNNEFTKYCKNINGLLYIINNPGDGVNYKIKNITKSSEDNTLYEVNCIYYEGENPGVNINFLVKIDFNNNGKWIIDSCEKI